MGLIEEIDDEPVFSPKTLLPAAGEPAEVVAEEALWDVVFARVSAVQEYGWHASLESLIWATDAMNGALSNFRWPEVQQQLTRLRNDWLESVVRHAKENGKFFPKTSRHDFNQDDLPEDEAAQG